MSTSSKVLTLIVVVALIVVGVWYSMKGQKKADTTAQPTDQVSTTTPVATTPAQPSDAVTARDSSNASLDADMSSVDSQLNSVDSNSAQVDQSLSDKPVSQTE